MSAVFFSALFWACQTVEPAPVDEPLVEEQEEESDDLRSASPMQGVVEITGYLRVVKKSGQSFVLVSDSNIRYSLVVNSYAQGSQLIRLVNKRVYIKGMLEIISSGGVRQNQILIQELREQQ